jgi:hypothetical protein
MGSIVNKLLDSGPDLNSDYGSRSRCVIVYYNFENISMKKLKNGIFLKLFLIFSREKKLFTIKEC